MELPPNLKQKHFLICDDYESVRLMMIESLNELGVTNISVAKSGNEGMEIIKTQKANGTPVEFVITDLLMEDVSGIELTKLIRHNEAFKDLPILMVTSKAEMNYVVGAVKAGVNGYIIKPWPMEALYNKIIEIYAKSSK